MNLNVGQINNGGEFYSTLIQKRLDDNYIFMYSTYNEGRSVVAERLIRTLNGKIYKKMRA